MNTYDLSILIPARNEMFLKNTIEDIIKNKRGKTEILVGLDGEWADPGVPVHDDVTILYYHESIGQRAMTNRLCDLSKAKYVMKVDAHCAFDEGFDVKMIEKMQDNYTMVPVMYNLYGFDWVCPDGHRRYQGPSGVCKECGKETKRDIIWKPRWHKKSTSYRFDKTLHFQYWGDYKKVQATQGDLGETLSLQGSCFMLSREKYHLLNICDEKAGSWGQQGSEVAIKTWLSGGRVLTNMTTWYAHMFRTQGGDFGFPYHNPESKIQKAREYFRDLFLNDKWDKAVHPFSWLIEKFRPIPDWHDNNKGIIFFTDNQVNLKVAHAVQKQLKSVGLPIVSASLKPMSNFGTNVHVKLKRGYLTMFKQILAALEASKSEIVYFCEHDVLYHPSHFQFTPAKKDIVYYNVNWFKVREKDGYAVSWEAKQVSGICAYRQTLIEHYRKRVAIVEKHGYNHSMGFEPGSHNYKETIATRDKSLIAPDVYIDDLLSEEWKSKYPYVDIRTDKNLSFSKWSLNDFRDKTTARNFRISNLQSIEGWDFSKGLYTPVALK